MKAEQAFEHEIRERPTSSATNFESSRSLKLWKSESFGSSQSSQTDSFVVDWSRCFICQQEEDESGNLTNGTDPTLEMLAKNMAWMHTNRFDLCLDDASLYHYGTNAVNDVNLAHAFISNKAKFHKSCKNRYIDSRIEKLKQKLFNPEQPPAKASKRERHSSAHDNTEERIRTAALYSVTDYILNQEKVSPGLYLVTELENMYNESVRAALLDPLATSSVLRTDIKSRHKVC